MASKFEWVRTFLENLIKPFMSNEKAVLLVLVIIAGACGWTVSNYMSPTPVVEENAPEPKKDVVYKAEPKYDKLLKSIKELQEFHR